MKNNGDTGSEAAGILERETVSYKLYVPEIPSSLVQCFPSLSLS
jgi:hypothetical protein